MKTSNITKKVNRRVSEVIRWLAVFGLLYGFLLLGMSSGPVMAGSSDNIDVIASGTDNVALPAAAVDFDAVALSAYEVGITWTRGVGATHTLIKRQIGSYPATRDNGVEIYWGTGENVTDGIDMTILDQDVYYRAWSWNSVGWSTSYAQDIVEVTGMIGNSLFLGCLLLLAGMLTFGSYWVKERALLFIAVIAWFGIMVFAFVLQVNDYDHFWIVGTIGIAMATLCAFGWTRMKKEPLKPWDEEVTDERDEEMDAVEKYERSRYRNTRRREPRY